MNAKLCWHQLRSKLPGWRLHIKLNSDESCRLAEGSGQQAHESPLSCRYFVISAGQLSTTEIGSVDGGSLAIRNRLPSGSAAHLKLSNPSGLG